MNERGERARRVVGQWIETGWPDSVSLPTGFVLGSVVGTILAALFVGVRDVIRGVTALF